MGGSSGQKRPRFLFLIGAFSLEIPVYEVTRTYQRRIFLWQEHWERMQYSASKLGIKPCVMESQLLEEIRNF